MTDDRGELDRLSPPGTVLITGASGGVGSAVARVLAGRASGLVLMDRTPPDGLAEELSSCPCVAIGVDLADEAAVDNALADASMRAGGITHLVHCAAVLRMSPVAELTGAEFMDVLRVNTVAAFIVARRVAELSRSGGGIALISSVSGLLSGTNSLAYSASKRALHSITQGLALEYGSRGVRVNAICPGTMETGIWTREVRDDMRSRLAADAREFVEGARAESSLGVLPTPEQLAELVVFLLSGAGNSTSGQIYALWGTPLSSS